MNEFSTNTKLAYRRMQLFIFFIFLIRIAAVTVAAEYNIKQLLTNECV